VRRPAGAHRSRRGQVRLRPGEEGQVAIVVALMLTVMLGLGALVVDVGLNWTARTQLQSAADAAALAGAAELPGQPDEALAKATEYMLDNVPNLADEASGWESDGDESNGDITCYTPPEAPPPPGDPAHGCEVGDTAIQVLTPPLRPAYAFASILGRRASEIKALAAAGAPPGPDAPCVLCVLSPDASPALLASGNVLLSMTAGTEAVVNSDAGQAAIATDQAQVAGAVRVVGEAQWTPPAGFTPAAQTGDLPVADPMSNLPLPHQLNPPYTPPGVPVRPDVNLTAGAQTIPPGIYRSIRVSGAGTRLTFSPGLYVITEEMLVGGNSFVTVSSATLYFACGDFPDPCASGSTGAGLTISGGASFVATGLNDLASPYRGLVIFYDRENRQDLVMGSNGPLSVVGTVYARSARLDLHGTAAVGTLNTMAVVDSVVASSTGGRAFTLSFDPTKNVSLTTSGGGLVR
jgi:Putative Flp pilus-assembly TadE/G-like